MDRACRVLGVSEAARLLLRRPLREHHALLPLQLDDGSLRVFRAWRVQYNNARGPAKGGLRWHPKENIDTIRALACWMTWKTALVDLPLGGGKGGIACNPKELSITERERLARAYIRAFAGVLAVDQDVPAPDVNTTPQIMAWMMDEYEILRGNHHPGVITGKPLPLGGSVGRGDATSYGGMCMVREIDNLLGLKLNPGRYAIQGFGNVGGGIAKLLHERGGRIVAIGAEDAAIYNDKGIDIHKAITYYDNHGQTLGGFDGGEQIDNESLLTCSCDVLIPAAIEHVITRHNADAIQAKVICELANGPTTPGADHMLHDRGITIVPDILANAGGVTVSYFEQVQNAYNYYWPLEEIHRQLDRRMTEALHRLWSMARDRGVTLRDAAYLLAVERVLNACKSRGWAW